jgi:hypothetical protein
MGNNAVLVPILRDAALQAAPQDEDVLLFKPASV